MNKIKRWYCGLSQLDSGEVGYTFFLDFEPVNEFCLELHPRRWVSAATLENQEQIFISAALMAFFEIDRIFTDYRTVVMRCPYLM